MYQSDDALSAEIVDFLSGPYCFLRGVERSAYLVVVEILFKRHSVEIQHVTPNKQIRISNPARRHLLMALSWRTGIRDPTGKPYGRLCQARIQLLVRMAHPCVYQFFPPF